MERGDIWWASLPTPRRSEPPSGRPVLIVQSNAFNKSRIRTVVVAVITSNLRLADAPGNVLLTSRHTGLDKKSVVNVSQVVTLDKSYLKERAGRPSKTELASVDRGLRLVLALRTP